MSNSEIFWTATVWGLGVVVFFYYAWRVRNERKNPASSVDKDSHLPR